MPALARDSIFTLPVAITFVGTVKLIDLLKTPPLHPVVTGAILFILTKAPDQYRNVALSSLGRYIPPNAIANGITALKVLFAAGIARRLNTYLNVLGQNNFRLTSEASKYDWPREIALVTGAAGGIGAAIATDFAAKGMTVIAVDIAPALPDHLAELPNVHYRKCDITDRSAVLSLAESVRKEHGDVSVLVNNAGLAFAHHTLNATEQNLRRLWDVNVLAHYWTLQAFLPAMIAKRKGHVVSTASIASFYPTAGLGPYAGTKVAALSIHESLAQELRHIHKRPEILLTVVHPTFVRTNMTRLHRVELEREHTVLTPEQISAGVCGNVFGGRGGQLVMGGNLGWAPTVMRYLPWWVTYSLLRAVETQGLDIPVEEAALK